MTCSTNCPQLRGEGQGKGCHCSAIASQNALCWPAIRLGAIYLAAWIDHFCEWHDRKAASYHARLKVMAERKRHQS